MLGGGKSGDYIKGLPIAIIRILNLISNPCWLVYNIYMGSIAGILTDSLVIASVVIAVIRLDIFPKKESQIS